MALPPMTDRVKHGVGSSLLPVREIRGASPAHHNLGNLQHGPVDGSQGAHTYRHSKV